MLIVLAKAASLNFNGESSVFSFNSSAISPYIVLTPTLSTLKHALLEYTTVPLNTLFLSVIFPSTLYLYTSALSPVSDDSSTLISPSII